MNDHRTGRLYSRQVQGHWRQFLTPTSLTVYCMMSRKSSAVRKALRIAATTSSQPHVSAVHRSRGTGDWTSRLSYAPCAGRSGFARGGGRRALGFRAVVPPRDPVPSDLVRSQRSAAGIGRTDRRSRQPGDLAGRLARRRRGHRRRSRNARHLDLPPRLGRTNAIHLGPRRRELVDLVARRRARAAQLVRHAIASACSKLPRPARRSARRCSKATKASGP